MSEKHGMGLLDAMVERVLNYRPPSKRKKKAKRKTAKRTKKKDR